MTDQIELSMRGALDAIGGAAQSPRVFQDLDMVSAGPDPHHRRPSRGLAVAAAIATMAVGGAFLVVDREAPRMDSAPTTTVPPLLDPVATPVSVAAWPVGTIVAPLLPPGFVMVSDGSDPLHVVAINDDGVRLDVDIHLGGADDFPRGMYADDSWVPVPGGESQRDGSVVLSDDGDVISAWFSFADQREDWPAVAPFAELRASITLAVATAITPQIRAQLGTTEPAALGVGGIGLALEHLVRAAVTGDVVGYGANAGGSDEVNVVVQSATETGTSSLVVSAIHTTQRLRDGINAIVGGSSMALRHVEEWQIILWLADLGGGPLLTSDTEIETMLDDVATLLTEWSPPAEVGTVCASTEVAAGDSLASISARWQVPLEDLMAVNPSLRGGALTPKHVVKIPCGEGASDATMVQRSADIAGLDAFPAGGSRPDQEFEMSNSVTIASDAIVWVVTGGTNTDLGWGMTTIETYSRATGEMTADTLANYDTCAGVIRIGDDPAAPLDAIPVSCSDGQTATLNLWNSVITGFER